MTYYHLTPCESADIAKIVLSSELPDSAVAILLEEAQGSAERAGINLDRSMADAHLDPLLTTLTSTPIGLTATLLVLSQRRERRPDGQPMRLGWRVGGVGLKVFCPRCMTFHNHGAAGADVGSLTHRCSHCSPDGGDYAILILDPAVWPMPTPIKPKGRGRKPAGWRPEWSIA